MASSRILRKAFGESKVALSVTERQINDLLDMQGIPVYPRSFRHVREGDMTGQPGSVAIEFTRTAPSGLVVAYRQTVRYETIPGPRGGNQGSTAESAGRALYWSLKAKFDAIAWGIEEFEEAFLPNIVDPGDPDHTLFENFASNALALPAPKE